MILFQEDKICGNSMLYPYMDTLFMNIKLYLNNQHIQGPHCIWQAILVI